MYVSYISKSDNTKRRAERAGGPCFQFENIKGGLHISVELHNRAGSRAALKGRLAGCTTERPAGCRWAALQDGLHIRAGCTTERASGMHKRAGRRAAEIGELQNRAGQRAAEQGGLLIYTCRRAVEKGGPFDSRTDCVKNDYFSQFQASITVYIMPDVSMQGRTALNIIEIATFRRSSGCATWRAVRYNIARTSCFENDDFSSLLHTLEFFAVRATAKQSNTPSYRC